MQIVLSPDEKYLIGQSMDNKIIAYEACELCVSLRGYPECCYSLNQAFGRFKFIAQKTFRAWGLAKFDAVGMPWLGHSG